MRPPHASSTVTARLAALAAEHGAGFVDPQAFLDAISGGAMDAPYVQLKGKTMIARDYPPAFALGGALKDSGLIADALRGAGVDDRLITALHGLYTDASAAGHAKEDMAAVAEVFAR